MMLLRLLNPQGIAGLAVSLALAVLLVIQKGESRHWRKQSGQFEQLYVHEQAALSGTVANVRTAAETARAADEANARRVKIEQSAINERISHEFEARLAAARAVAQRLRQPNPVTAADPGRRAATPMSGLSAASDGAAQAASEDRLSSSDALIATEQAIQLDELIKWVERQHGVQVNDVSERRPQAAGPSKH